MLMVGEIVRSVRADLAAGRIKPTEKLASERSLQESYRASRGTIREAMRILEGMGLVEMRKGRGGGAFITRNARQVLPEDLSKLAGSEESNLMAFLEFRRIIEPKLVYSAAIHRTDENVSNLKEAIDLLGKEVPSKELYVTSIKNFFQAIAESTQNDYIVAFCRTILPSLAESAKFVYDIPKCVELSLHFFSQVYEAVHSKDPVKGEISADAYLLQIEDSVKNARNSGLPFTKRKGVIKWGIMLDLTSATLDWGKQCAMGMIDAARYLNESGGINGKRIELIIYDDKYKLSESQLAYRKFKDEEKVLGLYIQSTGANLAIAPLATKDRMFMFSGGTTAKLSNPMKYPYYFSLGPTYLDIARAGIKYIKDSWTHKTRDPRLVFMYPDNIYGREPLEAAKMYASELGVDVGPDQIVNWPTLDATPQLLSMQAFEPDYALIVSTSMNAATILRDSKKLAIKTRFICNNRVFTEDLAKLAMGTAEGVLGIQSVAPYGANVPGMEKIVKLHDMRHPYHEPTVAYVDGWVNILVPMEAAKTADEAGKLTSDGIKEVLESFRHYSTGGLLPTLSFYEDDHRATTQARIYAIERESLVAITGFIDVGRDKKYFDI